MDAEAIMRAMLATASRRGQLFVTGNEDHILPVEPPVSCGHQSHPRIKTYSSDDVALLSERIQEGDMFYAAGRNLLAALSTGPRGSYLCYNVRSCRPEWKVAAALETGDWIFRSPPHWDVLDEELLQQLPA